MSRRPNALLALPGSGRRHAASSVLSKSHVYTTSTYLNASHRSSSVTPRHAVVSQESQHRYHFSSDRVLKRHPFHRAAKDYSTVASDATNSDTPRNVTASPTRRKAPQTLSRIRLNTVENALKTLFLDVAAHIHEKRLKEAPKNADIPPLELRFTGGWVRDKLLGVDSADIDLGITEISDFDFAQAVKEYMSVPENVQKYEEMGVRQPGPVSIQRIRADVQSLEHGGGYVVSVFARYIDIFTLRKVKHMRMVAPKEAVGSAEEDALRRDATINALFYNLKDSKVEDLTGQGIQDLKCRLIRTPSDPVQTLRADPVRILRLIRFGSERGYSIHEDTLKAMRDKRLANALRDKSRIRFVMTEVNKILKGPNPRKGLYFINRFGLYSTLFTTHLNGFHADTSSWHIAYDSLARLIEPLYQDDMDTKAVCRRVRGVLLRNPLDTYYAWMVTTLAPWITIPEQRVTGTFERRPYPQSLPPWAVEVAKDSLCPTFGTLVVLGEVSVCFKRVIDAKSALLEGRWGKTIEEMQEQVSLHIKSWGPNWRVSMIMAILQETMTTHDFTRVIREYDMFLKVYMRGEVAGGNEQREGK